MSCLTYIILLGYSSRGQQRFSPPPPLVVMKWTRPSVLAYHKIISSLKYHKWLSRAIVDQGMNPTFPSSKSEVQQMVDYSNCGPEHMGMSEYQRNDFSVVWRCPNCFHLCSVTCIQCIINMTWFSLMLFKLSCYFMARDEDSGRTNEFDKVNDSLMLHINQQKAGRRRVLANHLPFGHWFHCEHRLGETASWKNIWHKNNICTHEPTACY